MTIATLDTTVGATQIGITVQLLGTEDWLPTVQKMVDDVKITEQVAQQWRIKYDGYQMAMTFITGTVVFQKTANNAVNGACVYANYADGGWCVGTQYTGTVSYTANKWAQWSTLNNIETFNPNKALVGIDDSDNWRLPDGETFSGTGTFTLYRYLPKEQRSIEYYENEYRFSAGSKVTAFVYYSTNALTYTKGTPVELTLSNSIYLAMSSVTVLALAATSF